MMPKDKVQRSMFNVQRVKFNVQRVKFNVQRVKWDSRYLVGIGIYFGKPKKKETFIYNSS